MQTWREYIGNIHMHTVRSDGSGAFADLAFAARAAGLHFIIVTDHNVLTPEAEGYRRNILILVDAEIHDVNLQPEGNHLLCLNIHENPVAHAPNPQALIDAVHEQGGMAFLAHPFERPSPLMSDIYPWRNWEVEGYEGIELWNYMSEFRRYVTSRPMGLLLTYLPALFTTGPWPETLARWDSLTQVRPLVAIGGSDAHARTYKVGRSYRVAFAYRHCFRAVNTHLLSDAELSGSLEQDRSLVYAALRAGHCWVGYDLIGPTAGFRFSAQSGDRQAIMGDSLPAEGPIRLHVQTPAAADVRLLRNGRVVSRARGQELIFVTSQPGVYRVEAWRRAWLKPRGWIFSNPIYVTG